MENTKPLISSLHTDVIKRCAKNLEDNGMEHKIDWDPNDKGHILISVKTEDYQKAMHVLYPNRDTPRIGSVVRGF